MDEIKTKWWNNNWLKIKTLENEERQEIHKILFNEGISSAGKQLKKLFSRVLEKWDNLLKDNNLSMSDGLDSELSYVGDERDVSHVYSGEGEIKGYKGNWSRVVFNKNKIPNPPPKNNV